MKNILVVINTLGRAGAERALIEFLRCFDPEIHEVSLYVLTNLGELVSELPEYVTLMNKHYNASPILLEGQRELKREVLRSMFFRGAVLKCLPYMCKNLWAMLKKGKILTDKLLWRTLSEGGQRIEGTYDLAVAFLEGGSTYFVADHVKAGKKAAFIHVDYQKAGYTRSLDRDCYLTYDKIFSVSEEVKNSFLSVYPECRDKTEVFHNLLNKERICSLSERKGEGFSDEFTGQRILTVGRLVEQKALDVSIEALKLLKEKGRHVRWYVLGEGNQRNFLEERIKVLGLEQDFILLGMVENPYPYIRQAAVYVHASRFEGKSIAVQEAQILGKAVLVSDCSGNREQVEHNVDGVMCPLIPEQICEAIADLLDHPKKRERLGAAGARKKIADRDEMKKILSLL